MDYRPLGLHSNWWPDSPLGRSKLDPMTAPWLTHKGSLTAALIGLGDDSFQVNVLRQSIALPYWHEQQKLATPLSRAAMIREVELQIYNVPVVFARSIVPLALVSRGKNGLGNLGRTPLGHLLFKDGQIRVSKREFAQISTPSANVTARRTPYDYHGSTILVSEFFLPSFKNFI